jgi:hypothetical protein
MYGPSRPKLKVQIGKDLVALYDPQQIAFQFGFSVKNVRAHAARGHFGDAIVVNGLMYYRKEIVDNFKPARRGPPAKPKSEAVPKAKPGKKARLLKKESVG